MTPTPVYCVIRPAPTAPHISQSGTPPRDDADERIARLRVLAEQRKPLFAAGDRVMSQERGETFA